MKQLRGKVAVVTGAASGIGRALALAFAAEGMRVALADVDENGLSRVLKEIESQGAKTFARRTDVSNGGEVEEFAEKTVSMLGGVHLVCNNAGVAPSGAAWENTAADWQWALGVNLWGVIHGVRAFAPRLIAQDEGHILNTASVAGLIAPPGMAVYNVSKHAVVAFSETLYHDLQARNSKVGVSVLCPAYVPTGIAESERSRPKELLNLKEKKIPERAAQEALLRKAVASGKISAAQVAQAVLAAVKEERFYVLTHERIKGAVRARMEDILEERSPRNPLAL